jgi:hypothetical protein
MIGAGKADNPDPASTFDHGSEKTGAGTEAIAALKSVGEGGGLEKEEDYIEAVFGHDEEAETVVTSPGLRTSYAPWHHPVKQIVREYQWAHLVHKLVTEQRHGSQRDTLRYFTLPGADLLDVRVLAEALAQIGTQIEYFGFDSGYVAAEGDMPKDDTGTYFAAESELRQAGRITGRAEILGDKLEDIAVPDSHAAGRLKQRGVFDVINIDACDHLGYVPAGRTRSVFDALEKLLAHQLKAEEPWLLFVTTRANAGLLGIPTTKLQNAIHKNIELYPNDFSGPLADCIGGKVATLAADLAGQWSKQSLQFLKLFCVGLGKYLLQYYHAQQNLPARVELVSAFGYKVSSDEPDMLSLAFRITPKGLNVQQGSAGGASVIPNIELSHALAVVEKAKKLWDLDQAITSDDDVRRDAVDGMRRLLASANYDIPGWHKWLRELPVRPMDLDDIAEPHAG